MIPGRNRAFELESCPIYNLMLEVCSSKVKYYLLIVGAEHLSGSDVDDRCLVSLKRLTGSRASATDPGSQTPQLRYRSNLSYGGAAAIFVAWIVLCVFLGAILYLLEPDSKDAYVVYAPLIEGEYHCQRSKEPSSAYLIRRVSWISRRTWPQWVWRSSPPAEHTRF